MPPETTTVVVQPFWNWLAGGLVEWLAIVAVLTVVGTVLGWLVVALQRGPQAALDVAVRVFSEAAVDLTHLSPRRVAALTWLTVKESIRRRVLVVFAVFIVCLLFAGWFLDPGSGDPARLYLGFVLTTTTYLVLLLAWFLSTASLPADIKKRTLFTVVTKPVRRSEIVLGRMLGFATVGSGLLLVMCPISYVFVVRGLAHTHELPEADIETAEQLWNQPPGSAVRKGPLALQTSLVHGHRHTIYVNPLKRVMRDGRAELELAEEGRLATQPEQGHWHAFSYETYDEELPDGKVVTRLRTKLGPVLGRPIAREPVFGELRFKDRDGRDAPKGISVGDEWGYRSFIHGGTRAAAIWTFQNVREQDFPDGIRVEMTIEIFRSYKGDIEKGVLGSLWVRRPAEDPKVENWVEVRSFEAKEFVTDVKFIPRELETPAGEKLDLFGDIIQDGKLEVRLRCEVPNQYFGAAPHDLYLRAGDAPFAWNFAKGYLGIWLQMLLVVGFGVMFSTFLSTPIAMLCYGGDAPRRDVHASSCASWAATNSTAADPANSSSAWCSQDNLVSEMEPGLRTTLVQMLDVVLEKGLLAADAAAARLRQLRLPRRTGALVRGQRLRHLHRHGRPGRVLGGRLRGSAVRGRLLLPQDAGGGPMSPQRSFVRKNVYLAAIVVLLVPLYLLSRPATPPRKGGEGSPGGLLARMRKKEKLSQSQLGQIDPAGETIKLATLGMRGVATLVLWEKANEYYKKKDWVNFSATVMQTTKLQPHFVSRVAIPRLGLLLQLLGDSSTTTARATAG